MRFDNQQLVNILIWVCCSIVVLMALLYAFEYWVRYRKPGQIDLYLASQLIEKGDQAGALVKLNHAIKENPQLWAAYLVRSSVYGDMQRHSEARNDLQLYLAHQPENGTTRFLRASQLLNDKQFEQALLEAEQALKLEPDHPGAMLIKTGALKSLNRDEEAKKLLETVSRLLPNNADVHVMRSVFSFLDRRHEEALHYTNQAIQAGRLGFDILLSRASINAELDRYDEMKRDVDHVLSIDPHHEQALALKATYLNETNQMPAAMEIAEKLIAQNPHDADLWNLKGLIYSKYKQYDQMLVAMKSAAQLAPKDPLHLRCLGAAHSKLRQWEKAIAVTEQAMAIDPNHPHGKTNKAFYLICLGNVQEAYPLLQDVLNRDPKSPYASVNMGWLHYVQNQESEAETWFAKALKIKPSLQEDLAETRQFLDEYKAEGRYANT